MADYSTHDVDVAIANVLSLQDNWLARGVLIGLVVAAILACLESVRIRSRRLWAAIATRCRQRRAQRKKAFEAAHYAVTAAVTSEKVLHRIPERFITVFASELDSAHTWAELAMRRKGLRARAAEWRGARAVSTAIEIFCDEYRDSKPRWKLCLWLRPRSFFRIFLRAGVEACIKAHQVRARTRRLPAEATRGD